MPSMAKTESRRTHSDTLTGLTVTKTGRKLLQPELDKYQTENGLTDTDEGHEELDKRLMKAVKKTRTDTRQR